MTDPLSPDYYALLGVPETATDEEIARAYRRLARQLHPDANVEEDAARFRDATDAYDVVRDRTRRAAYDASRRGPGGRGTSIPVRHGPAEGRRPPSPPQPATAGELTLSFREAVLGTTAKVQVDEQGACAACKGSGREPTGPEPCPACEGEGANVRHSGPIAIRHQCARCEGRGRLPAPRCETCGGTGALASSREVTVRIPPGVEDGSRVRIPLRRGQEADRGEAIYATVRVRPHPHFSRRGRDVAVTVPITLAEAALGAEIRVPSVDGRGLMLRVPPGTHPGPVLRVAGAGVPSPSQPGDLLVTVEVVVPKSLSDAQRHSLEAFAAATESPRGHLFGDA